MLPLQSTSTDIVPRATRSPLTTALSGLTFQPAGILIDQVPSARSPEGTEVAIRTLLLAEGAGDDTKTSRAGLKGTVACAVSITDAAARTTAKIAVLRQPPGIRLFPLEARERANLALSSPSSKVPSLETSGLGLLGSP